MNSDWITIGRTLRGRGDVIQNLPQWNRGALDELIVAFGAPFELCPYLALIASRISKPRRTCCRWNMLALVISTIFTSASRWRLLELGACGDDFVEIAIRRRFAVAGKSNVVQVAAGAGGVSRNFSVCKFVRLATKSSIASSSASIARHFDKLRFALLACDRPGNRCSRNCRSCQDSDSRRSTIPPLRRLNTGYTKRFASNVRSCSACSATGMRPVPSFDATLCCAGCGILRVDTHISIICREASARAFHPSGRQPSGRRRQIRRNRVNSSIVMVVSSPSSRNQHVAVDLVVGIAAEMQPVAAALLADHGAEGAC